MKTKYRLVTEPVRGFQIEIKPWWSPFWFSHPGFFPNSFSSQEYAEDQIRKRAAHKKKTIVKIIEIG